MAELFLPVLSHFQNENPWTSSIGRLRCRILPTVSGEEETAQGLLTAQVWEGPWAYEFSTVEETKTFPLSQEGLEGLREWLTGWGKTVNARPPRSLEEDMARRVEPEKKS